MNPLTRLLLGVRMDAGGCRFESYQGFPHEGSHMSWGKKIFELLYKRNKFDYLSWLLEEEEMDARDNEYYWLEDCNMGWHSIQFSGAPSSMEELATLRLLTLLHKLSIKSANKFLDQKGWDF